MSSLDDGGPPGFPEDLANGHRDAEGVFVTEARFAETLDLESASEADEFAHAKGFTPLSNFYGAWPTDFDDGDTDGNGARLVLDRVLPGLLKLPRAVDVPLCPTAEILPTDMLEAVVAELDFVAEQVKAGVVVDVPRSAGYANISDADYLELVRVLHNRGLVTLLPVTESLVTVGLFGVDKKKLGVPAADWEQRLITDMRRTNAYIRLASAFFRCYLPSPEDFSKLLLHPDVQLFVAQTDLVQCFYRCAAVGQLSRLCGLPSVMPADLGLTAAVAGVAEGERVVPSLCVIPMGFVLAPTIVQQLHVQVVRHALRDRLDVLVVGRSADLEPLTHLTPEQSVCSVYLDDLNTFAVQPALANSAHALVKEKGYKPYFLLWSEPKDVLAGETATSLVLGLTARRDGTVGLGQERVRQYSLLLTQLVQRGVVSGRDLAQACGRFCWAALLRRTALSALHYVFGQLQSLGGPKAALRKRPWAVVVQELLSARRFLPGLCYGMQHDVGPLLFATDASSYALGGTYVDGLSRDTLVNIVRADALTDQGPTHGHDGHHWKTFLSLPTSGIAAYTGVHITTAELAAVYMAVCRATVRLGWRGRTVVVLVDNHPALLMANKGKSRSPHQLDLMRRIDKLLSSSGCRIASRYVSTHYNPADPPSRLRSRSRPSS